MIDLKKRAIHRGRILMRLSMTLLLTALVSVSSGAQSTTDQLLDTLQHTAFNFLWQEANPSNGLIKDRGPGTLHRVLRLLGLD